jgi:hypothetical protein
MPLARPGGSLVAPLGHRSKPLSFARASASRRCASAARCGARGWTAPAMGSSSVSRVKKLPPQRLSGPCADGSETRCCSGRMALQPHSRLESPGRDRLQAVLQSVATAAEFAPTPPGTVFALPFHRTMDLVIRSKHGKQPDWPSKAKVRGLAGPFLLCPRIGCGDCRRPLAPAGGWPRLAGACGSNGRRFDGGPRDRLAVTRSCRETVASRHGCLRRTADRLGAAKESSAHRRLSQGKSTSASILPSASVAQQQGLPVQSSRAEHQGKEKYHYGQHE